MSFFKTALIAFWGGWRIRPLKGAGARLRCDHNECTLRVAKRIRGFLNPEVFRRNEYKRPSTTGKYCEGGIPTASDRSSGTRTRGYGRRRIHRRRRNEWRRKITNQYGESAIARWDHHGAARTIQGYQACRDYVSESVRGAYLLTGARTNNVQIDHRSIGVGKSQVDCVRLICESDFLIDQPEDYDGYFYLQLVFSGRCEFSMNRQLVLVESGYCAGINPSGPLTARWQGLCNHVLIRLNRDVLERTLAEELDIDIREPFHFIPTTILTEECRPVTALIDMLIRYPDTPSDLGSSWFGCETEQFMHLAALRCFPSNYTEMLRKGNSAIAPFYVRRAEEYLRRHTYSDVTLEDLAHITGVSTRTLFSGFRRWRNTTPMAYFKKVRLNLAKDALRKGATGVTVSQIATSVGYTQLGRFSTDYKRRFGETPSQTLRRGRDGTPGSLRENNFETWTDRRTHFV